MNSYKRKEHYSIKDNIEVRNEIVNILNSIKMDEKYCLRNTRRVSTDINSSIMNAIFHNDRNNEIDVHKKETQTWPKLINMIEISIYYSVTPAYQIVATRNDNDTDYTK